MQVRQHNQPKITSLGDLFTELVQIKGVPGVQPAGGRRAAGEVPLLLLPAKREQQISQPEQLHAAIAVAGSEG